MPNAKLNMNQSLIVALQYVDDTIITSTTKGDAVENYLLCFIAFQDAQALLSIFTKVHSLHSTCLSN
jgi:hypothetical protein